MMMDRTLTTNLPRRAQAGISQKLRALVTTPSTLVILYFLAHFVLAWLSLQFNWVATIQVAIVSLCGLWWAFINPRLDRLAMVGSYIIVAEALWRMSQASPFWEFGKYSLIGLFALALIKTGRLRGPLLAFLFFGCLLPSIVLPMANSSMSALRDNLSFYLSGPLALTVSTWFFSHARLKSETLQKVYYSLLGPAITLAAITLFSILMAENLRFSNNSNMVTSGGFGPNQVSTTLGLGILFAFLAYHHPQVKPVLKAALLVVMLFLTVQSALTFSRSGLYLASGGIVLAAFFLIRDRRYFAQMAFGIGVLLLAINFLLLPQLEKFTGGLLAERFTNTRLTNRDRIAEEDLQAFSEHPIFGVGPGQTRYFRQNVSKKYAAHTEFSRLLAEHGIFGLVAIFILFAMGAQHYRQKRTLTGKALAASMISWSLLFMLVSAMRLAAPSFAFGLSAATVVPDPEEEGHPRPSYS